MTIWDDPASRGVLEAIREGVGSPRKSMSQGELRHPDAGLTLLLNLQSVAAVDPGLSG